MWAFKRPEHHMLPDGESENQRQAILTNDDPESKKIKSISPVVDTSQLFAEIVRKVPPKEHDEDDEDGKINNHDVSSSGSTVSLDDIIHLDIPADEDTRRTVEHTAASLDLHSSAKARHDFGQHTPQERIHSLTKEFRQALSETLQEEKGISVWDFYKNLSKSDDSCDKVSNESEEHTSGRSSSGALLTTGLGSGRFRLRSGSDASALTHFALHRLRRKRSIDVIKFPHHKVLTESDQIPEEQSQTSSSSKQAQSSDLKAHRSIASSANRSSSPVSSKTSTSPPTSPLSARKVEINKEKKGSSSRKMKESNRSNETLHLHNASVTKQRPDRQLASPRGSQESVVLSSSPRNTSYTHPNRKLHRPHDDSREAASPSTVHAYIHRRLSHLAQDEQMRERSSSDVTHMLKKKLSRQETNDDHNLSSPRRKISVDNLPLSPRNVVHLTPLAKRGDGKHVDNNHHLPMINSHACKHHKGCDVCNDLVSEPNNLAKNIHLSDFPMYKANQSTTLHPPILKGSPRLSPISRRRATVGHVQFARGCKAPDMSEPSSVLSTSPKNNHGVYHYVYDEKTKHSTAMDVGANGGHSNIGSRSSSLDSDFSIEEESAVAEIERSTNDTKLDSI